MKRNQATGELQAEISVKRSCFLVFLQVARCTWDVLTLCNRSLRGLERLEQITKDTMRAARRMR
jgi:hypothetical protein